MSSGMGDLRAELLRKLVHVGSGAGALLLRWLTPAQAAACAGAALIFNLVWLHRLTGRRLLRPDERPRAFSWGIALYPGAVLALILVFHARLELAAATWGMLAFGDGMAGLVGRAVGGPGLPWNPRKTWAGLVAFVLWSTAAAAWLVRFTQLGASAVGASFLATRVADAVLPEPVLLLAGCLVAALAAGFAESLDTGLDDNVLVPLVGGGVLWLAAEVEPGRVVDAASALRAALPAGAAINAVLAIAALALGSVTVSGAVWGCVLGTALYALAGGPGFAMLLLFFVLGSGATRVGRARKEALGIAEARGGRRSARNAFANVSTGLACAFLATATSGAALARVALAAAFATATFDTVSSEIGKAFGRRHYLITGFRRVAAGTEGAVSLEGTLAGCVGAAVLAGAAWLAGLVDASGAAAVLVAAFVGATAESYIGALASRSGRVDNELINFTNTVIGAACGAALALLFGGGGG